MLVTGHMIVTRLSVLRAERDHVINGTQLPSALLDVAVRYDYVQAVDRAYCAEVQVRPFLADLEKVVSLAVASKYCDGLAAVIEVRRAADPGDFELVDLTRAWAYASGVIADGLTVRLDMPDVVEAEFNK